ncbi:MAG: hypothetical protein ABSA53_23050 [Streptosporangiaceae bacterium]|jgi:hypothetical protein
MMQFARRCGQAVFRPGRPVTRSAAGGFALVLAVLPTSGGLGVTPAYAASQAPAGCLGVTRIAIPPQGVITNVAGTEGGHLWWRDTGTGTCVGTVVEDVQVTAAAPTLTLRVIVFDTADPGGLTVARQQIAAAPGPVTRAFGIHQVFPGLTAVCLAATSPVVPSPDLPCAAFGQPVPAQQFTQPVPAQQFTQPAPAQQSATENAWLPW